jgi:23S rRNA (adenine2503-C2)-methyltransferase
MTAAALKAETRAPMTLAGASRAEMKWALAEVGVPERELNMRASQFWHWIYHRGAREFSAMRNIARPLLEKLAERRTLARPEIAAEQVSADGTRKWLLRMPPAHSFDKGAEIECVYIPESDRGTLCVSSQVGCTLNCSFCHTGTMPLVRNLTAAEIVGQVLVARDRLGDFPGGIAPPDGLTPKGEGVRAVSNIVFMGMGEPLYNFEAVRDAIAILTDGDGLSLSKRRITVSTSGVVPEISEPSAGPCSRFPCTRPTTACATSSCR